MDLWKTLTTWVDEGADWVAEALDYKDIANVELMDTYSAGDQLIDDAFGFIKKGATAYKVLTGGGKGPEGYKKMPAIQGATHKKARSVGQLTRGGTRGSFQTSPITGNPMYNHPDVRSSWANLAAISKNTQMNDFLGQFTVAPNIRSGSQTIGIGSTQVKGIAKRPTTIATK